MVALTLDETEIRTCGRSLGKNSLIIDDLPSIDPILFVNGENLTREDKHEITNPVETLWAISLIDSLTCGSQTFLDRSIAFTDVRHYNALQEKWLKRFWELTPYRRGKPLNELDIIEEYGRGINKETNIPVQSKRYRIYYALMHPEKCKVNSNLDYSSKLLIETFGETADKAAERNFQQHSFQGLIPVNKQKIQDPRQEWQYQPCYTTLWLGK